MSCQDALRSAAAYFDEGTLLRTLKARVALATESQIAERTEDLRTYLQQHIIPELQQLGFMSRIVDNPLAGKPPFLIAERHEEGATFTVLSYGHGDVVRGHDTQWRSDLSPWQLSVDGERWYGRGTADNKGQHTINFAALAQVIRARAGRLGYNVKLIFEMGEELGSPGLNEICLAEREALAADLFIASDGPRVAAERPTLFLGSRGLIDFDLIVDLRPSGYHSGNWGGLLKSPGIRLAHALASLVDEKGKILVAGLRPNSNSVPQNVRDALAEIPLSNSPDDPAIDLTWGEPDLTPAERVWGWNALEILAFETGVPQAPVNAIPGRAFARCQLRFVVGSDSKNFMSHLRQHLDDHGFTDVTLVQSSACSSATRLDPDDPWVRFTLDSMARATGKKPALLPNLGGTLPNSVFSETLGLPTLWLPHSHPSCAQHAPNEHLLAPVAREAFLMMTALFWDLSESGAAIAAQR